MMKNLVIMFFILSTPSFAAEEISLPSKMFTAVGGLAVITGSWYIVSDGHGPIKSRGDQTLVNTSNLVCVKSERVCHSASADLYRGYLSSSYDEYEIASWGEIIKLQSESQCVSITIQINTKSETVTQYMVGNGKCDDNKFFDSTLYPKKLELIDGFQWQTRVGQLK